MLDRRVTSKRWTALNCSARSAVQSPSSSAMFVSYATQKARSSSDHWSQPPTAVDPTSAPATRRLSERAFFKRPSRTRHRSSTVNIDTDCVGEHPVNSEPVCGTRRGPRCVYLDFGCKKTQIKKTERTESG